jgi:hypothetical protein
MPRACRVGLQVASQMAERVVCTLYVCTHLWTILQRVDDGLAEPHRSVAVNRQTLHRQNAINDMYDQYTYALNLCAGEDDDPAFPIVSQQLGREGAGCTFVASDSDKLHSTCTPLSTPTLHMGQSSRSRRVLHSSPHHHHDHAHSSRYM